MGVGSLPLVGLFCPWVCLSFFFVMQFIVGPLLRLSGILMGCIVIVVTFCLVYLVLLSLLSRLLSLLGLAM